MSDKRKLLSRQNSRALRSDSAAANLLSAVEKEKLALLQIYSKALLPDSVAEHQLPTPHLPHEEITADQAEYVKRNYCCELERALAEKQHALNLCQQELETIRRKCRNLTDERDALNWQVEYDRSYLQEIKTSRSWFIARCLHYIFGFLRFNTTIAKEAKNDLDTLLLRESQSHSIIRGKVAVILHYLICGAGNLVKTLPTAEGTSDSDQQTVVYQSAYQDDESFDLSRAEAKLITFYLPQFHTFPENDKWWGKGFTEWTNTRKAQPRFPGHYQPRTPHMDIGYYDLADVNTLKRQVELAKAHGITAFCMYYYWFDGKKLMEKPLEMFLAHPEIDFKFCLCWANENWTRTWDGQANSVLIQQNYSEENDVNFIADLKRYLKDPRYLRCNGRPVILVYHAKILPDSERTFQTWRQWCRKNGVGEIQIWSCRTFIKDGEYRKPLQADREVEFPPHMVSSLEMFHPSKFEAYEEDGFYYDYSKIIRDVKDQTTMADRSPYPMYRCTMLGWDNSCRRATGYSVWQYFSLQSYHFWLRRAIEYTKRHFIEQERFVFINAWNEWAEGTYLEPDERYGYASINTTTRALCNLPVQPEYEVLSPHSGKITGPGKILIHFHCFYPELADEFIAYFNHMPFAYDCVITTTSRNHKKKIEIALKQQPLTQCPNPKVMVVDNHGRDVAPFFASCSKIIGNYDFVGHFHTKRSLSVTWGNEWRHYLLDNMLGSSEQITAIFRRFQRDAKLGVYFPPPYPAMRNYINWEKNRERCEELLKRLSFSVNLPAQPVFPVGQMFWARTKAVGRLFTDAGISRSSFEREANQQTNTLAHAIERIWSYVAEGSGYSTLMAHSPVLRKTVKPDPCRRLALYVHYSADNTVSECDLYMLRELKTISDIIFINNGRLKKEAIRKLLPITEKILERENKGYDFAAWHDALSRLSLSEYDELILLNNSIAGPFIPFANIFDRMRDSLADFWGMTEFPETGNPRREEAKNLPGGIIPRHLQSYFLVFRKRAFESSAFQDFWANVSEAATLPEVVAKYETQLSGILEKAGLKSDVYLKSSGALQNIDIIDPSWNALYCRPLDFVVLGFPFLKKNICYYLEQPEINETIHQISLLTGYPSNLLNITHKTR